MERLKRCTFSVALDSLEGLRGVDIDGRGRVDIDGDLGCLDIDIGLEEIARLLRKVVV